MLLVVQDGVEVTATNPSALPLVYTVLAVLLVLVHAPANTPELTAPVVLLVGQVVTAQLDRNALSVMAVVKLLTVLVLPAHALLVWVLGRLMQPYKNALSVTAVVLCLMILESLVLVPLVGEKDTLVVHVKNVPSVMDLELQLTILELNKHAMPVWERDILAVSL